MSRRIRINDSAIPLPQKIILHLLNEDIDTVPTHILAFVMEVEILVFDVCHLSLEEMRKRYNRRDSE